MRILHVGFGFRPWIVNGLIIHTEDLMHAQAGAGHEVGYFCAGRQLPLLRRSFLHEWRRGPVRIFEWMNSGLVVGSHLGSPDPDRDLSDPPSEAAFARVLKEFAPDVVHIQDLGGLPSSLAGLAGDERRSVVMTLHDYLLLCPTVKLYDADQRICDRRRPGQMCVVCCGDAPGDNRAGVERTVRYERGRIRSAVPHLDRALRRPALRRISEEAIGLSERALGLTHLTRGQRPPPGGPELRRARATAEAYQRRRDENLTRLGRLDAVITFSDRSQDVCGRLGVDTARMRTIRMNPGHIERLRPKRQAGVGEPLRFAALNACSSTQKGANLVLEAVNELSRKGLDARFRLVVHGPVASHVQHALATHPAVILAGEYRVDQLDQLLETVDVGLMPSVWEEVYGFAGLEFLAKGIPVIGNARGAIPDYVRPGQTGWLNRSATAAELAELMIAAIEDPAAVQTLGARTRGLRDELISPLDTQVAELSALYHDVRTGIG
jgi:glycosyltransferase involved in cell wall biosynthesis